MRHVDPNPSGEPQPEFLTELILLEAEVRQLAEFVRTSVDDLRRKIDALDARYPLREPSSNEE